MIVQRDDLEAALATLTAQCRDPVAGPWGPDSVLWKVAREKGVLLAGGRAALLQLAHPYVGEAVASSSLALNDPLQRFRRTFEAVYGMVFGTLDHAVGFARQVHRVHTHVGGELPAAGRWAEGHRYAANEPHALQWVLATLVDGAVLAFERVHGGLTADERERFWQDARQMGLLVGLTELPGSWAEFRAYFDGMLESDALAVTPRAGEVGRRLLIGPDWVTAPAWATYRATTAALMPERLRAPFGLRYGLRERALAKSALTALRIGYRHVPARIRCVPAWKEACWRLQGGGVRRDRVGRWLEDTALHVFLRPTSS